MRIHGDPEGLCVIYAHQISRYDDLYYLDFASGIGSTSLAEVRESPFYLAAADASYQINSTADTSRP